MENTKPKEFKEPLLLKWMNSSLDELHQEIRKWNLEGYRHQFETGMINPEKFVNEYESLSWMKRNFSYACGTRYEMYHVAKELLKN